MTCLTLMIQGTSSSVGKSVLVAALCRIFARRGVRVAPFKAQNMSNNAAVCSDGAEIGRSQAVQAAAARIAPTACLNPILLKPEADSRSQVIVQGRPWRTLQAREYYRYREELWPVVTASLDQLRRVYDLVVIEGAGSPAELNLRDADIVNMAIARYCEAPVLLVGDIDRGGIFAQLLGTLSLLNDERRFVRGLIVNKFRGDPSLFASGVSILEERSGVPVLGVVPWLADVSLPEEDGQSREDAHGRSISVGELDIAIIGLPRIANFDDFDSLDAEAGVGVRYVTAGHQLGHPAAAIIPGTKSTIADLHWLRQTGLAERIGELEGRQTVIVGICGGYQMLGQEICDPHQVESCCPEVKGLGLLPTRTVFSRTKETHQIRATVEDDRHCRGCRGQVVDGYEIHMGQTSSGREWLKLTERSGAAVSMSDGAVSDDGRIWGCYLHGLFGNDRFRQFWLNTLRTGAAAVPPPDAQRTLSRESMSAAGRLDAALERLANEVEASLDMNRLNELVWAGREREICLQM